MASFSVSGMGELEKMFDSLAELPESVIKEMLDAQADIVTREQKRSARSMLQGPLNQGAVANSIRKGRFKRSSDGGSINIEFEGTQHGNRLTEIAFINEFGKRGQPARPFIQTANESCADETTQAAQDVFNKWVDKQ